MLLCFERFILLLYNASVFKQIFNVRMHALHFRGVHPWSCKDGGNIKYKNIQI